METGFSAVCLYGFLDYCDKHRNDPALQEIFENEYECAQQRGYIYDLWFYSEIMKHLRKEGRIAFAGGSAGYSALSYCSGITDSMT